MTLCKQNWFSSVVKAAGTPSSELADGGTLSLDNMKLSPNTLGSVPAGKGETAHQAEDKAWQRLIAQAGLVWETQAQWCEGLFLKNRMNFMNLLRFIWFHHCHEKAFWIEVCCLLCFPGLVRVKFSANSRSPSHRLLRRPLRCGICGLAGCPELSWNWALSGLALARRRHRSLRLDLHFGLWLRFPPGKPAAHEEHCCLLPERTRQCPQSLQTPQHLTVGFCHGKFQKLWPQPDEYHFILPA